MLRILLSATFLFSCSVLFAQEPLPILDLLNQADLELTSIDNNTKQQLSLISSLQEDLSSTKLSLQEQIQLSLSLESINKSQSENLTLQKNDLDKLQILHEATQKALAKSEESLKLSETIIWVLAGVVLIELVIIVIK